MPSLSLTLNLERAKAKEGNVDNHVRLPDMVAAFTAKHKPRYP